MAKFILYALLFYLIYFVIKTIVRIYIKTKSKPDNVVNPNPKQEKKSQIDKNKIVDAEYEEL